MNAEQQAAPPPDVVEEEAPPQPRFGIQWDPNWCIVTVKEASANHFDNHSENTVLLGILLLIKHHSSSNDSSLTVRPRSTTSGSTFQGLRYGNQRTSTYDRIFMFANVGMQGKCFAIIMTSPTELSKILKYCNYTDYCTLGDYFAILEPDSPTSFLQDSPIIAVANPKIPIKRPLCRNEVPLLDPTPGEQRYFLFHGLQITVMKTMIVPTSCSGKTCNRQVNYTTQNTHCGCLYKANGAGIMLKMNVRFSFVLDMKSQWYTVTGFQSWRMSNLFLQPVNRATNVDVFLTDAHAIHPTVSEITDYVNANGGWTICGWLRRGEVVDASAAPNDANSDVVGSNIPIHLAYLYPTSEAAVTATEKDQFAPPPMPSTFGHGASNANPQGNSEGNTQANS